MLLTHLKYLRCYFVSNRNYVMLYLCSILTYLVHGKSFTLIILYKSRHPVVLGGGDKISLNYPLGNFHRTATLHVLHSQVLLRLILYTIKRNLTVCFRIIRSKHHPRPRKSISKDRINQSIKSKRSPYKAPSAPRA